MEPDKVAHAVALATRGVEAVTDDEREKLRLGDKLLLSVLRTGHTLTGRPIVDKWNGKEPPDARPPLPIRKQQIARLILKGYRIDQAAAELGIKPGTAYVYMKELREQTGEQFTWRAALMAALWGWLDA